MFFNFYFSRRNLRKLSLLINAEKINLICNLKKKQLIVTEAREGLLPPNAVPLRREGAVFIAQLPQKGKCRGEFFLSISTQTRRECH